ncbi:chemotaxis protein CheW [Komagataeibacter nataicola]|uniref:Chemotaxis protein CheW n=1 Tax=Komagataeibacter nataicola TaxID=265960 RepID=A0A9N7CG69_9PROT|nr:chemotaxis protein CheW [Komagataeibacter nataicola]AQU86855.1 chemotaxis protein CheW [Komagataeibacter nataicola]PYD67873.1 chemotaxis protein CheW [Komagataeibacter nataicola]WEQ56191.1 chemotaxis protein CheW [Komagataeibacter nataicola]WNM07786.1 chemotaxis protein CheW [Komagataeibacter nataicola]
MDHASPQQATATGSARPEAPPVMVFRVGERQYGLPAGLVVRECMPVPALRAPMVPVAHVSGWFRLGAEMVAVLDLGVLLGVRAQAVRAPLDLLYRPLLLCNQPGGGCVALLVDAALDVMRPQKGSPAMVDAGRREAEGAGQELERGDGSIVFMLRMTDILDDDERMRLDSLLERTRARAALWAQTDPDATTTPDGAP